MAVRGLSDGELQRLRYELGANVLEIGAEPYIGHQRIFDVIQANLASDATEPATSATDVVVAGSATLTLDSVAGLSQFARVVLDADDAYEVATVKRVSGLTVTVQCAKAHAAPFPVEIESGLTLVRCKLWQLAALDRQIREQADAAGIKKVDEVEFFGEGSFDDSPAGRLYAQQARARAELASLVCLGEVLASLGFGGGGGRMSVY